MQAIIPRLVDGDHDDWPSDYDECTTGCDDVQDVRALAFALANMEPDVWSPARPGEPWVDFIARRDAARDILDDLLAEAAGEVSV